MLQKTSDKSIFRIFILLLFSVIVSVDLVEIGLRLINFTPEINRMNMFQIEDNPLLPYKLTQGYKGYYLGTKVTVESEGERKVSPKPLVLNQNSKTILIVGDSVVFGWGLEDDETIASQLQAVINEKGLSHKVKKLCQSELFDLE